MPDSEDDYERRNREKFVREREYSDRSRGRDFNADRNRRDFSNGVGIKRMGGRRDEEPPFVKRNRFDSASDSFDPQFIRKDENSTPVMLTFKKFLATQDESLTDEEAIAKYLEYKIDFQKQECEKYFRQHKDEEWFRLKYNPDESKAFKEEQKNVFKKRLDVFNSFLESGLIGRTSLDYLNAADIIRLLDSVVIKLEDGSDEAINELNEEEIEDESVVEVAKIKAEIERTAEKEINGNSNTAEVPKEDIEKSKETVNSDNHSESTTEKKKKSPLHKTCSIYFKTIPSNSKLDDLENICKQHPGFLRIGLTDPLPEAMSYRHGWVTYRRDVNIKEIFWSLKNAKLGSLDLGAVVNRDLKRRIRYVSGVTLHRSVVQNDIREAAKLIALYDNRTRLFLDAEEEYKPLEDLEKAIIDSKNPILNNIVEYLVEEENAEEEALLGLNGVTADDAKILLEVDCGLLKVLDKLILYLRIVHSVDYYHAGEYLNEDSMPNRIGMLHVRGVAPSKNDSFVTVENSITLISKKIVDQYVTSFNNRLTSGLLKNVILSEEDLEKLGKKDAEKAVEEFVATNCVELAKEKWLCPLSGKKFKGPEFIHKHLKSKHADKLHEVRDEVLYFNNYITDPQRPQNELVKPLQSPPVSASHNSLNHIGSSFGSDFDRRPSEYGYRNNWNNSGPRGFGGRSFQNGGNRDFGNRSRYFEPSASGGAGENGGRRDPRPQVPYRDLDAPEEIF